VPLLSSLFLFLAERCGKIPQVVTVSYLLRHRDLIVAIRHMTYYMQNTVQIQYSENKAFLHHLYLAPESRHNLYRSGSDGKLSNSRPPVLVKLPCSVAVIIVDH
jgi:hypothetical protein